MFLPSNSKGVSFLLCRETETQAIEDVKANTVDREYKFEFSYVSNDRRPSQKSGTCCENRNSPNFPGLSATILDVSWESLGRSGNSEIPDRLIFSQHMAKRQSSPVKPVHRIDYSLLRNFEVTFCRRKVFLF